VVEGYLELALHTPATPPQAHAPSVHLSVARLPIYVQTRPWCRCPSAHGVLIEQNGLSLVGGMEALW
jgi:hypothetical protein